MKRLIRISAHYFVIPFGLSLLCHSAAQAAPERDFDRDPPSLEELQILEDVIMNSTASDCNDSCFNHLLHSSQNPVDATAQFVSCAASCVADEVKRNLQAYYDFIFK